MTQPLQIAAIARFTCLGDACPDTCCQGWSMQVDALTQARYANYAPELLPALREREEGAVEMQRDPTSDMCVKLARGWCGIQRDYGADFLGDACYFYPRVVRRVGGVTLTSATLSCPEIARLSLLEADDAQAWQPHDLARQPTLIKDYGGVGESDSLLAMHAACLNATDGKSAGLAILELGEAARSLQTFAPEQWAEALPMALRFAPGRVSVPEAQPNDLLNLLLAFCGLLSAANRQHHLRLRPIVERIAQWLDVPLSWDPVAVGVGEHTAARLATHPTRLASHAWLPSFFQCWLRAELSASFFPFSGLGDHTAERAAILGFRLSVLALALGAHETLTPEQATEDAQILARFLDHLAEPELTRRILADTGWDRPARLHGLLSASGAMV